MDPENILSVGLAVCLLFALGASANALGEAVSTDPDEVIDVDYASLPFNEDDAGELRDAVTGEDRNGPSREQGTDGQRAVPDESGESTVETRSESGDGSAPEAGGDNRQTAVGADGDEGPVDGGAAERGDGDGFRNTEGQGTGPGSTEPSLLDRLLSLLGRLLPFVLLLAALALTYALRHRLRALLRPGEETATRASRDVTYVAEPEDEVSAAWYEMVATLGLDQELSKTPRECERAARESGADPSLVRTLTELYEQVRYADEPVTEERSRQARETVEQFKRQYGGTT